MKPMVACLAALVLLLAGCTSSGTTGSATRAPGKYEQTWTVSYGSTTCRQWLDEMTADQRFVAAHDFAIALNAFDTGDSFAQTFAADISTDCRPAPSLKVKEVAAALATIDAADFPR